MIKAIGLSLSLLALSSMSVLASGMPVIDAANLTQTSVSAFQNVTTAVNSAASYARQLLQYKTQLDQYADQLKNTVGPAVSVWQDAQGTIGNVLGTVNAYQNIGNDLQGYLNKFQGPGYWMSAPSSAFQPQTAGLTAQKTANDALLRGILMQQDQIKADAASLQQLQGLASGAQGRNQALQYANQLASLQAKQLMDVRTLLLQAQAAEQARAQTLANDEAMRLAADQKFFAGSFQYSSGKGWQP
jgi:P-type conjugative transfer protein TrbJ